jgi:uncharacterized membrane protein YdjX (TVP38/TMEM64 family)
MMGTLRGFFIARVCMIPLPEVAAYAGGLTRIGFLPFLLIYAVVGAVPATVLSGLGFMLTVDTDWLLPVIMGLGLAAIPLGVLLFRFVSKEWEKTQ